MSRDKVAQVLLWPIVGMCGLAGVTFLGLGALLERKHRDVSIAFAFAMFAAAGVLYASIRILARRETIAVQKLNLCEKCGYDLRATPDRCPECGSAPASGGAPA